jgi:putative sigma-54 modulation protein
MFPIPFNLDIRNTQRIFPKTKCMDINFQYDEVKASDRLEIMAAKKLDKLQDKYDFIIRADVLFKKENTSSPKTGMICKIRLSAPGPQLFAEASHGSFEASIAETVSDLERQLRKRKEKMKSRT